MLCNIDPTHTHTHGLLAHYNPCLSPFLSCPVLSPVQAPCRVGPWHDGPLPSQGPAAPRCKGRCASQLPCCPSRLPWYGHPGNQAVLGWGQVSGEPLLLLWPLSVGPLKRIFPAGMPRYGEISERTSGANCQLASWGPSKKRDTMGSIYYVSTIFHKYNIV